MEVKGWALPDECKLPKDEDLFILRRGAVDRKAV
jgi:hypothetical protein